MSLPSHSHASFLAIVAMFVTFISPGFCLVIRDTGPESIIIQLKQSTRTSSTLDTELQRLQSAERSGGVTVAQRWVGRKYLEDFISRDVQ